MDFRYAVIWTDINGRRSEARFEYEHDAVRWAQHLDNTIRGATKPRSEASVWTGMTCHYRDGRTIAASDDYAKP